MPDSEQSGEVRNGHARSARADDEHEILDLRRAFTATIPDSSVGSVRKVARFDGRTRIIAARTPGGSWWRLRHRLRFTRDYASELRRAGISEVILKRGFSRASFPLAWLSNRQA